MTRKALLLLLAVLFVCVTSVRTFSQSMCVIQPISVERVKGQIFFGYEGKRRPEPNVRVEVTSFNNDKRVIAKTIADAEGRFEIRNLKPGKYFLRTTHEKLIGLTVEMNVLRKGADTSQNSQVVFVLGGDFRKRCGGGDVTVEKKPDE